MSVWAELEGLLQPGLFAGKKNSTWGNICQFEMLFCAIYFAALWSKLAFF